MMASSFSRTPAYRILFAGRTLPSATCGIAACWFSRCTIATAFSADRAWYLSRAVLSFANRLQLRCFSVSKRRDPVNDLAWRVGRADEERDRKTTQCCVPHIQGGLPGCAIILSGSAAACESRSIERLSNPNTIRQCAACSRGYKNPAADFPENGGCGPGGQFPRYPAA